MAVDKRILEDELKQYAINTLNFLADEVDLQFGKWSTDRTGFLPLLCDAHQQAVDKQTPKATLARRSLEPVHLLFDFKSCWHNTPFISSASPFFRRAKTYNCSSQKSVTSCHSI